MTRRGWSILAAAAFCLAAGGILAGGQFRSEPVAKDRIAVDSTADTGDHEIGDGRCDDGTGRCTLRAAIEEANADPDRTTISFAIEGEPDFETDGYPGYTISPATPFPPIARPVVLDGYSQPHAAPNTAPAPEPLDARLLVEIQGRRDVGSFELNGDHSVVRGLVINGFDGTGLLVGGDHVAVQGNYIGLRPSGLEARSNRGNGVNSSVGSGLTDPTHLLIGGLEPAQRNIISGNEGAGITPNAGDDHWVIQGNYIGIGADGTTPIPNSAPGGPGGLSIDNCADTLVGGSEAGAANVISGNTMFGIFPDNTDGLVIQGNIIGPDWRGRSMPDSRQIGGIGLPPLNGPFRDTLIGGTGPHDGNLIAFNHGAGVAVVALADDAGTSTGPEGVAILRNSIYANSTTASFPLSTSGLGIELLVGDADDSTVEHDGPTPNDDGDTDTGPNGFINAPVLLDAVSSAGRVSIWFDLDAADAPGGRYRVEFFTNEEADPSGYGEGQTFLGAVTVANGGGQDASLALPDGIDLAGQQISATTTAIDPSTRSGFGGTSEFSMVIAARVRDA